ncbi:MAG: hypothetical protein NZ520_00195 [bacterium]|nr:hypothetical protein [bacterium]
MRSRYTPERTQISSREAAISSAAVTVRLARAHEEPSCRSLPSGET